MVAIIEAICAAFIVVGGVFMFVGSFGLAKLPDMMRRLHAPTKATTLGIGALLIASIIYFVMLRESSGIHEILITLFLFLTAPVTAKMIAKTHIFKNKDLHPSLPPAAGGQGWATLSAPPPADEKRDGIELSRSGYPRENAEN
jgi:multicomponent K+:H+ antiporter subunit G